ncbi:MAG TPA: hypothetical protein VGA73_07635, partial [Candidatus Binatia bacterium]
PLAGVVVVAVWYHQIPMIIQMNTVLYKAREALTDKNGEFVINAEDIEGSAPSMTLRPTFKIFLPGYGSFPRFGQTTPRASDEEVFEGAGSEVELPRVKAGTERLLNYRELNPYEISKDPFTEVPNFMRLINEEARNLGLEPYRPREK